MLPTISDVEGDDRRLSLTVANCSVSLPNAFRRTILSDIPCVAINVDVDADDALRFQTNTTRLTNEMIAQRLACIPVHITDVDFPLGEYSFLIKVSNTSESSRTVTSKDIEIIRNGKTQVDQSERDRIFPPDALTKDFIEIATLKPSVVKSLPVAALHITGNFRVVTARENGSYSVVTEAICLPTQDLQAVKKTLKEKEKVWLKEKLSPSLLQLRKNDFMRTDAYRQVVERSFTLGVRTVGVFTPREIMAKAAAVLTSNLDELVKKIEANPVMIRNSLSTIPNSFDMELTDNSVTLGRLLESVIFDEYSSQRGSITYSGFSKPHPHRNIAVLRFAFPDETSMPTAFEFVSKIIGIATSQVKSVSNIL